MDLIWNLTAGQTPAQSRGGGGGGGGEGEEEEEEEVRMAAAAAAAVAVRSGDRSAQTRVQLIGRRGHLCCWSAPTDAGPKETDLFPTFGEWALKHLTAAQPSASTVAAPQFGPT